MGERSKPTSTTHTSSKQVATKTTSSTRASPINTRQSTFNSMISPRIYQSVCICISLACIASAFVPASVAPKDLSSLSMAKEHYKVTSAMPNTRKAFIASIVASATVATGFVNNAYAEDEGFESIAARAANMAKIAVLEEDVRTQQKQIESNDPRSAYDFDLPVAGDAIKFADLIKQEFTDVDDKRETKVKAILVVNMKQDDPLARKNIPELISLASK